MPLCASRVLIVDDDPVMPKVFEAILANDGHTISAAPDARSALLLLRIAEFDLMILDMSLPDMDGLELIRQVRDEFPHIQILAISGFMGRDLRTAATTAGAAATMGKPPGPSELRRVMCDLRAAPLRMR